MGSQYNKKHGGAGNKVEKLYKVWIAMKQRCFNKNDRSFKSYGDRGIFVCDQWINNYGLFRSWCLLNGYKKGMTIDRINNDGPYSPENCRFVKRKIQNNNKRQTWTFLEIDGKSMCIKDWAQYSGVNQKLISCRRSRGWTDKESVFGKQAY